MLFREDEGQLVAISQPAHAWIAGRLLRQWSEPLSEPLLFAAEQHDIGWLEWEAAPSFNPDTGRPHSFRELAPRIHAPLWRRGVDLALAGWGRHVALLVSRHGGSIYRRFARPAPGSEDAAAIETYLVEQGAREAEWQAALGLQAAEIESGLLAFSDALSLALCGDLKPPLELHAPLRDGGTASFALEAAPKAPYVFNLSPWPFRAATLVIEGEGWLLPAAGQFADESEFRSWFRDPPRRAFRSELRSL